MNENKPMTVGELREKLKIAIDDLQSVNDLRYLADILIPLPDDSCQSELGWPSGSHELCCRRLRNDLPS